MSNMEFKRHATRYLETQLKGMGWWTDRIKEQLHKRYGTFIAPQLPFPEQASSFNAGGKLSLDDSRQACAEKVYSQADAMVFLWTYATVGDLKMYDNIEFPYVIHHDNLYGFCRTDQCTISDVLALVRSARHYPFIALVTPLPSTNSRMKLIKAEQTLLDRDVRLLTEKMQMLVTDVYDGEGFMYWIPASEQNSVIKPRKKRPALARV